MQQTFHVGMLVLGCGSAHEGGDSTDKKNKLGTNLFEVTALRTALSQHNI